MTRRLCKSHSDRMIAGVCGGLGEYFGVDPVLVRLAFVLLSLVTGIAFLAYPVLWIVMPEESSVDRHPRDVVRENLAKHPGGCAEAGGRASQQAEQGRPRRTERLRGERQSQQPAVGRRRGGAAPRARPSGSEPQPVLVGKPVQAVAPGSGGPGGIAALRAGQSAPVEAISLPARRRLLACPSSPAIEG